ncbi:MAG: peptidylprolyl isomerase, partial [Gammaproteobacteria bacterium]|nr:peptidylprolyl isomerase [Gammaproteobacteria bacterium]
LANDPNSATNQWFFNLADNSNNLDFQNEGFTVFGEVTASGMDIVDQIAALPKYNLGGALTSIPLQNYDGNSIPDATNFALVTNIYIIDATVKTAPANIPLSKNVQKKSSGGGGSLGIMSILLMGLFAARRKFLR